MDSSIESAAAANGSGEQLASQLYVAAMLASMKTEFPPGPPLVYGHGFGPPVPGLVLDLSPTAPASAASQQRSLLLPPVDQSPHTPVTVDEENGESMTLPAVIIKREIKTELGDSMEEDVRQEEGHDGQEESGSETDAVEEGNDQGCSRTLPRMPEAWRQKRHQQQVQVIQQQQQQQIAMTLTTAAAPLPPPPPPVDSGAAANKRKALIHPQQRNPSTSPTMTAAAVPSTIPVGIAVARQRAAESSSSRNCGNKSSSTSSSKSGRSTPLQPKALRLPIPIDASLSSSSPSTSQSFMSTNPLPPHLIPAGLNYGLPPPPAASSRVYNPTLYGSPGWPPTAWSPASTSTAIDPHYSAAASAHAHVTAAAHAASLWPQPPPHPSDLNTFMGNYSAYASSGASPGAANSPTTIFSHHHQLHHAATAAAAATTPAGLTSGPAPPYLLIPTACLDPYQRAAAAAAMLWPGYAAPAQSPWTLPSDIPSMQLHSQTSSMIGWSHSLHSSFELPILRAAAAAAAAAAAVNVNDSAEVHPSLEIEHVRDRRDDEEDDRDVKPVVAGRGNIKEETTSPEPTINDTPAAVKKESSPCVNDYKPLGMAVSSETPTATIRVKENIMSPESSPVPPSIQTTQIPSSNIEALDTDSNYSGLQLLSDSIERFMATAAATTTTFHRSEERETSVMGSPDPPREIPRVASGGSNALDVLCAAALYQQVEHRASSPAAPTSESFVPAAVSCDTIADQRPPHGFQIEFDFRSKLAELQRKYKEKQKELSSLRCKRKESKSERKEKKKKRRRSSSDGSQRRKSCSSNSSRDGLNGSSSSLSSVASKKKEPEPTEAECNHPGSTTSSSHADFIVPGRLDLLPSSLRHRSTDESPEELLVPRVPVSYAAALASAAVVASSAPCTNNDGDGLTSTVNSTVASVAGHEKKKRKPDFPVRKQETELTETIVPSKKRKFFQLFQWCHSSNDVSSVADRPLSPIHVKKSNVPLFNKKKNSTATASGNRKTSSIATVTRPKIKPKLKAEVQVKRISSASSCSGEGSSDEEDHYEEPPCIKEEEGEEVEEENENQRLERHCLPALQLLQLSDDSGTEIDIPPTLSAIPSFQSPPPPPTPPASDQDPVTSSTQTQTSSEPVFDVDKQSQWQLTQDLLQDGLRVLIAEEGLFRGGAVTCIRPPDIYGILVDGERGSRPRIFSTEELLQEAMLEVKPSSLAQLPIGTRICAYWSRKSRCLYPGAVVNLHPATKPTGHRCAVREDELDVEFDDGDSGRITIGQILLLPPDYPVLERTPSPLMVLESRRKRRASEAVTPLPAMIPIATVKPSIPKQSSTEESEICIKKELDESKQNGVDIKTQSKSKRSKKQSKKASKKVKREPSVCEDNHQDLIIPVSPGLAIEPTGLDYAAAVEEEVDERPIKMETRASSTPTPTTPLPPISRKTTPKSKSPVEPRRDCAKSKISAFLPDRQLWEWMGPSFKKSSKGKGRKEFYKAIQRGDEIIRVGDCAVFLSSGRPDRPYVGRIELLWESWGGSMTVKVRWFYHPEETCGGRRLNHLKITGALFESNHVDENDVQTISHCCTVSSLNDYRLNRNKTDVNLNVDVHTDPIGRSYDQFYLAGFYDPTSGHLSFEQGVLEQ